jgi:hypothetical protein
MLMFCTTLNSRALTLAPLFFSIRPFFRINESVTHLVMDKQTGNKEGGGAKFQIGGLKFIFVPHDKKWKTCQS